MWTLYCKRSSIFKTCGCHDVGVSQRFGRCYRLATDKKNRTEPTTDVTTSSSSNYAAQPAAMMPSYGDMNAAYAYPQQWGAYAVSSVYPTLETAYINIL